MSVHRIFIYGQNETKTMVIGHEIKNQCRFSTPTLWTPLTILPVCQCEFEPYIVMGSSYLLNVLTIITGVIYCWNCFQTIYRRDCNIWRLHSFKGLWRWFYVVFFNNNQTQLLYTIYTIHHYARHYQMHNETNKHKK